MSVQNKVFIRIHEFECGLEEITSKVGLNPTRGWLKGDLIPNRKQHVHRKQSTWELQSSVSPQDEASKHIEFLLDVIESRKEAFKELVARYQGELSIISHIKEDFNPGINLSNDLIRRIAALGLEIDFDLYFFPDRGVPGQTQV